MVTQREKLAVSTKQYFLFLSSISGNIALVRKLFFFLILDFSGNVTALDSLGGEGYFVRMVILLYSKGKTRASL